MNRLLLSLLIVSVGSVSLATPSRADTDARYTLDDGTVRFVCEGPKVTVPAWGEFGTIDAALSLDPRDLGGARGRVDVLMVSVHTEDAAWDTMFRRAGFLEIDEHPKSRFVLDKIHGAELKPGEWVPLKLEGEFTLHGVTKKVLVPAAAKWQPANRKAKKSERVTVRANFHIKWDDYEIAMPRGSTRLFAGDGAHIQVNLKYKPARPAKTAKR